MVLPQNVVAQSDEINALANVYDANVYDNEYNIVMADGKNQSFSLNARGKEYIDSDYQDDELKVEETITGNVIGRAMRAFVSPFVAPIRGNYSTAKEKNIDGAGFAGGMLWFGLWAMGGFMILGPICAAKGLYNIYNTFKNGADYHPVKGRSTYNKALSKARSSGKTEKLTPDGKSLNSTYINEKNKKIIEKKIMKLAGQLLGRNKSATEEIKSLEKYFTHTPMNDVKQQEPKQQSNLDSAGTTHLDVGVYRPVHGATASTPSATNC